MLPPMGPDDLDPCEPLLEGRLDGGSGAEATFNMLGGAKSVKEITHGTDTLKVSSRTFSSIPCILRSERRGRQGRAGQGRVQAREG